MADLFDTPLFRPRSVPTIEAASAPTDAPARRAKRAAPAKARPARPASAVVDLPWRITTPAGEVAVTVDGDWYRISGPSGDHVLSTEPRCTDRDRLVAHVEGYVTSNGGTFTAPLVDPAEPEPPAPPPRLWTGDLVNAVQAEFRAARERARPFQVDLGGILRAQIADVFLVWPDGTKTRTDAIEPAAIRGTHLLRWRKAAREAGASTIRLEGEIGWAESTAVLEIVPTGERWSVEVGT